MTITQEELQQMTASLAAKHGIEVIEIASMLSFFWNISKPYERIQHVNFTVLGECIRIVLKEKGISHDALEAAARDVDRANATLTYLMTLPD
jgi:hypothetical protein